MVIAYGFGSYFSGALPYRDKDLLLVHKDLTEDSCRSVINCKRVLLTLDSGLHITILSETELASSGFMEKITAYQIGSITDDKCHGEYKALLRCMENAHNKVLNQMHSAQVS